MSDSRKYPEAPSPTGLPQQVRRARVAGEELAEIDLRVRSVTPIVGASPKLREVDAATPIRGPGLRGQWRFWWRALSGLWREKRRAAGINDMAVPYASASQLAADEARLWGRSASRRGNDDARSRVEVAVLTVEPTSIAVDDVGYTDELFYALWPVQEQKKHGIPPAHRWEPGLEATIRVRAPKSQVPIVKNVLRAWLLFGGYGARTRRGAGALTVVENVSDWLPEAETKESFVALFGEDPFASPAAGLVGSDMPLLGGSRLAVGGPVHKPEKAWEFAVNWLRDFRQEKARSEAEDGARFARKYRAGKAAGPSRWPEADKVRQLARRPRDQHYQYNSNPAWPRAQFGLPIQMHFIARGEPDQTLLWTRGGETYDRLASPLITKAMPLADGRYVPIALWLNRGYPEGGEVALKGHEQTSRAPFGKVLGEADEALYEPLRWAEEGGGTLRDAFFRWLRERRPVQEVT